LRPRSQIGINGRITPGGSGRAAVRLGCPSGTPLGRLWVGSGLTAVGRQRGSAGIRQTTLCIAPLEATFSGLSPQLPPPRRTGFGDARPISREEKKRKRSVPCRTTKYEAATTCSGRNQSSRPRNSLDWVAHTASQVTNCDVRAEVPMRIPDFFVDGWCLEDGEEYHRAAPETFPIPDLEVRHILQAGDFAKLVFRIAVADDTDKEAFERMWVIVRNRTATGYMGILDNEPSAIAENDVFWRGSEFPFEPRHIIAVSHANEASRSIAALPAPIAWKSS